MSETVVLAVDQGTTNSKAVLVTEDGRVVARGAAPVPIEHPRSGWVQQDAEAIWQSVRGAIAACLAERPGAKVAAIGLSNQRESVLTWDRRTGRPLGPVVTWQCRRTAEACERIRAAGHEERIIGLTGLPLDPLFPAPKVRWLLDNLPAGTNLEDVAVGTVDAFLINRLTGGAIHACDRSNAARTQLFDLERAAWSEELCGIFGVPAGVLPQVRDSSHVFGHTAGVGVVADGIPVASAIGDSHGALFGHGAFAPGDGKATFGTGSSVMTTIPEFVRPPKGLTTTIAWSLHGTSTFAYEGNILVSASVLPWAAELLGVGDVAALLDLAQTVDDAGGVALVPAFVGLGAPHWAAEARGLVAGLSFGTRPAHVARAAAESIAFQVNDVFEAIAASGASVGRLFVDGGPSSNPFLMGLVSGMLDRPVITCESTEASALGAASLAGLAVGVWPDLETVAALEAGRTPLHAPLPADVRARAIAAWRAALARTVLEPSPSDCSGER